jgi:ribonuclease HII
MAGLLLPAAMGFPGCVAGVDEAGRGPLAGPVVAAAVVLRDGSLPKGLNDSKILSAARREALRAALAGCADIGIGQASVEEIDTLNIHWATMLAMERAVVALVAVLCRELDHVLVDGNRLPRWQRAATALVQGDGRCLSIAAASIIAKTERDGLMAALDVECPGYGWARNQGYGTAEHGAALERLGATAHHRRSFAPVARVLERG